MVWYGRWRSIDWFNGKLILARGEEHLETRVRRFDGHLHQVGIGVLFLLLQLLDEAFRDGLGRVIFEEMHENHGLVGEIGVVPLTAYAVVCVLWEKRIKECTVRNRSSMNG